MPYPDTIQFRVITTQSDLGGIRKEPAVAEYSANGATRNGWVSNKWGRALTMGRPPTGISPLAGTSDSFTKFPYEVPS
jgi:hypothetical protein